MKDLLKSIAVIVGVLAVPVLYVGVIGVAIAVIVIIVRAIAF